MKPHDKHGCSREPGRAAASRALDVAATAVAEKLQAQLPVRHLLL